MKRLILILLFLLMPLQATARHEVGIFEEVIKPWIYAKWQNEKPFDDITIRQSIQKLELARIEDVNETDHNYLVDITLQATYFMNYTAFDKAIILQRLVFGVRGRQIIDWVDLPQMRMQTLPIEAEL